MAQTATGGISLKTTEHRIGNTTYIVKSYVKDDAKDTILSKIGKLIKNEINKTF